MSNTPLRAVNEADNELAALRVRAAELEKAKAARDAERAAAEELAAARREVADAEAIERAEAEHGPLDRELKAVHTDMGVILLKRAHPAIFKRFQDAGSFSNAALDKLVAPCVVHPMRDDLDRIMDRLPYTLKRCADAVVELAGFKAEDNAAK